MKTRLDAELVRRGLARSRDHAADLSGTLRDDVQHLDYEAYDEQVVPVFARIEAELRQQWAKQGAVPMHMSAAEFDKFLTDDIQKWGAVIKAANIKVD